MDNPIRVAVMGCNGRMGKVLLEAITNAEGVVRIKPQNLLLNLPLASAS